MKRTMAKKNKFGPKNREEERIFAIEALRADVQHVIYSVMQESGISRKELAEQFGCSQANITQILSEDGNPQIDTLAKIFFALGDEPRFTSRVFTGIQARIEASEGSEKVVWEPSFANTTVTRNREVFVQNNNKDFDDDRAKVNFLTEVEAA